MDSGIEERVKRLVRGLGADACGIGAIERFADAPDGFSPTDLFPACRSVISFGIALPKGLLSVEPRLLYSHFNGSVACAAIDALALTGARALEDGFACVAVPVPCDDPSEYWDAESLTARGLISLKHTAVACGLGQLGKNTLLLNPFFGNRLILGAILTDLELRSDEPCESICIPSCHRCTEACPASAIVDGHVEQRLCRPVAYGKTARGFGTVDCNRCRSVCPMRFGARESDKG